RALLDRVGQQWVRFAGADHIDLLPGRFDADRLARLAVSDYIEVLACPGIVLKYGDRLVERLGRLDDLSHQLRHRHALPISQSRPAHFADRDVLAIHSGHTADEPG